MISDPSDPKFLVASIIRKSLRTIRFEEKLAIGLTNCVEGKLWDEFLEAKKQGPIDLDFRLTVEDASKEGERLFKIGVVGLVNGKVVSPVIIDEVMRVVEEEIKCECDQPLYQEDKKHCAFCGGVVNAR